MSLLGLAPLQGMKWELLIHPGADSISRYQVRPAKLALNVCVVNLSLHHAVRFSIEISGILLLKTHVLEIFHQVGSHFYKLFVLVNI